MLLDDIEERAKRERNGYLPLIEYGEIDLLIRAVRQLGAVHRAMKKLTHLDVMIDPDVLELIGGEE